METLVAAFVMGLMGSGHCLGMCGGFAAACARPRWSVLLWNAGRLTTYAVLGAIGGLAGGAVPGPRWLPVVVSLVLLVWFAAALAELVPQPRLALPGLVRAGTTLARREGPGSRYLFGVATGLLPCGMVYAALALAIAGGAPLLGAAAMVAFGLGTAPALTLLGVGVQQFAARGLWQRRTLALLVLLAGLWSIARRPAHPMHRGAGAAPAAGQLAP
ncbi:MAG: sulfite exporter TauE/SafE family protein, partial [Gemmatimonadetes bacterium]|nr:sulfite exporter TauE/SafE family protein [Gemmatimonadota bacterium]